MKITLSILAALFLYMILSCHGENLSVNPSQSVLSSFDSRFGKEVKPQWQKSGQTDYKAIFNRKGQPVLAYFDSNGKWLRTESVLPSSELPVVLVKTIVSAYYGSSIHNALQVERADSGTIYRLTLKSGPHLTLIDLSPDGVILNQNKPK